MSPRQPVAVRGVGKPHIVPDGKGGFVCYQPTGARLVVGYGHGATPVEAYRMWQAMRRKLKRAESW